MKNIMNFIKSKNEAQSINSNNVERSTRSLKTLFTATMAVLIFVQKAQAFQNVTRNPLTKGQYGEVDYRLKCAMAGSYAHDSRSIDRLGAVEFRFKPSKNGVWIPTGIEVMGTIAYNIDLENDGELKYEKQIMTVNQPDGGQFLLPQKIYIENAKGDRVEFDLSNNEVKRTFLRQTNRTMMTGSEATSATVRTVERPEYSVELIECDSNNSSSQGQI